ncbi:MAG: hypothetical protein MAG453_01543 [Calditrichaeota bacterium]|nr:hypothetical protein [Calditrichota bacterium]
MLLDILHHIPILTTLVAAAFLVVLWKKYTRRRDPSLLWWTIGVFTYAVGTALESVITVGGNTLALNKAWYIAGALWGGYPLGQGTVYLMYRRATANKLTAVSLTVVVGASIAVLLSPVHAQVLNPAKPGGDILAWQWVRYLTPFVNTYAALFLIGGAILSAVRFLKQRETLYRARGAGLIAIGGLLPGIGGSMAKAGVVEGLYVGEFFGILCIFAGTVYYSRRRKPAEEKAPDAEPAAAEGM